MIDLKLPIEKLPGVGPRNLARLQKLGVKNIKDLLWHFPNRYEDFSQVLPIEEVIDRHSDINKKDDENATPKTVCGEITDIGNIQLWPRRRSLTRATIEDGTGSIRAIWFNQPYIKNQLAIGSNVSLSGKIGFDKYGIYISNPSYEKVFPGKTATHTGRLVPVYPETEGITSKYLRFLIKPLLPGLKGLPDPLPAEILKKYGFPKIGETLNSAHFPDSIKNAESAKKRMAFEEILLFQLRALRDRRQMMNFKAPRVAFNQELVTHFVKGLPFKLTDDQRRATFEILKDLERAYPMNRLLNGDVGSGKTVVALIAAREVAAAGYQAVFMAPTEILAKQHFETVTKIFAGQKTKARVGLLTGSEARQWPTDETTDEKITKKLMASKIAKGEIDIAIGTHAVIQKNIKFKKLGLVIIDEQHRFGVKQRMKLIKNPGHETDEVPHLLSMTATPIPRTLAMTVYGDLDISIIKEKPAGRQEILTRVIVQKQHAEVHEFVRAEIKSGRQAFVICPRIEITQKDDSPADPAEFHGQLTFKKYLWAEAKAVKDEYEKLSKNIFPDLKVAMLHGRMKPKEKDRVMRDFRDKKYDLLVSTSVIEVGVDIPNASIMMVRSAERFGLAQLHQFRGRVGRGEHKSHCLLFADSPGGFEYKRLSALEKTNNGFELAEIDLKLRGPGEFTGTKQSGIPDLMMASLGDVELIKKARFEARQLLKDDPGLKSHPLLLGRLSEMQRLVHFE